ncbi:MAG: protein translocase subunit SecD [Deltaproteobacteria bacterium]|nr:protein translocase subunit SecD [Deltaproteobacteria bacterium]
MLRTIRLKFLFLFVLTVFAILLILPSFPVNMPAWWTTYISRGLNLGLDLRGGMHLVLEVDMDQALTNALNRTSQDLKDVAEKRGLAVKMGEVSKDSLDVTLLNRDEQAAFQKLLTEEFPQVEPGLPQRQDGSLVYALQMKSQELEQLRERTLSQSLEVLRNRIDQFGVTEPVIVRQGDEQIVVQLPGIQDPQRAMDLIGQTAQLEFKLVDEAAQVSPQELIDQALKDGRLKPGFTTEEVNRVLADKIPPDDEILFEKRRDRETGRITTVPLLIKKKVLLTGEMVKDAKVSYDEYNEPQVSFTFTRRGGEIFGRITGENVKRRLAIILDGVVKSAPTIEERIGGGSGRIHGSFTTEQAKDLAIVLRSGALPASVKIVQNITVGPTLGADSIRKGLHSGLLAGLLVIGFMIFYYRFSGLVADYALILNTIMLLGALSLFNATLTLPGIAGIILSLGMAVDSNVLIYERMREEFATGKPLKSGIDGGYDKAFWTIIDSHVTTLITALALFLFGTGPIKGFAVTLSLGVTLNLFTALFGTRVVYEYTTAKRWLKNLSFFQFFEKPNLDFISWRRYAFVISLIISLVGIAAFIQLSRGYGNLGVEFSGGAMVRLDAKQAFTVSEVRRALDTEGWGHAEIQPLEDGKGLMVKVKRSEESVGQMADKLVQTLNKALPQSGFSVIGTEEIGASVSKDLRKKAIIAIVISLIGIIAYIAWRFELIFGIVATVATFHDVLAVLGAFYLLNIEITLLVVTALLTIAGYSLTDTVVVFDRIRENLARRRGNLGEIINLSVNEVLSRTIITSLTVLIVVLPLYLFGGLVLKDFALAMILGLIVGSYSSVFVASPIVFAWRKEVKRVEVKREKVVELAAQQQKRSEKKAAEPKKKKKGGKK